jgi:hypothetical protein
VSLNYWFDFEKAEEKIRVRLDAITAIGLSDDQISLLVDGYRLAISYYLVVDCEAEYQNLLKAIKEMNISLAMGKYHYVE